MAGTIEFFLDAKAVVSPYKNCKNCLEIFRLSGKASVAPRQCWDIMAQISIDTFHRESVIFVADIVNVLSWKNHIQVPKVSISTIIFRLRGGINHLLDRPGRFVPAYHMSHYLTWFSAHHRHNVEIFPCLCPGLVLHKPIQLIQFHCFCTLCRYFFSFSLNALFLSNSSHWTYSSSIFSLLPDR